MNKSFWWTFGNKNTKGYFGSKKGGNVKNIIPKGETMEEKKNRILALRVEKLFDKYIDDKEVQKKIKSELSLYKVNMSIAMDFKDKVRMNELTKKLNDFLYDYEKKDEVK